MIGGSSNLEPRARPSRQQGLAVQENTMPAHTMTAQACHTRPGIGPALQHRTHRQAFISLQGRTCHRPRLEARGRLETLRANSRDPGSPEPDNSSSGAPATFGTNAAKWAAEVAASPLSYVVAGFLAVYLVGNTGEQAGSILVFAALPVTALTLLSKSSVGKQVALDLEARLPELQAGAEQLRAEHQQARQRSKWYGPQRPRLPGPLGAAEHLQGQVAGDAGFDPLGLSKDTGAFARNFEAELLHARWAMLGALGCLIPEALDLSGVSLGEPIWWKVGAAKLQGDLTFNWGGIEGFRIAGKQGIGIIAACQAVLMGGPEYARYVGIRSLEPVGVFLPGDTNYPGGSPFDPLGFAQRPDEFVDQSVRELKNGRLAMVAMLGYAVQAVVTQEGPVGNLLSFLEDPAHNNLLARLAGAN